MMDRRQFIGTGVVGTALLTSHPAWSATADMRRIPATGALVPAVGLGTWMTFNVGNDPVLLDQSFDVMRTFFEEGGGMIDSSPMYGSAQNTIGLGLNELDFPKTLFSADKIWTSADDGPSQFADTQSLWGADRFDLMQVHNLVDVDAHLQMLFQMKDADEIGHVGVTTSHGRRHGDLEDVMRRYPLDFVQLTYNVLDRDPYRRGDLISRTAKAPLPGFAKDLGAGSWAELMLKFVLSHPAVTVVIPATTQPEHVVQNKTAARTALPDEALRERMADEVARL